MDHEVGVVPIQRARERREEVEHLAYAGQAVGHQGSGTWKERTKTRHEWQGDSGDKETQQLKKGRFR